MGLKKKQPEPQKSKREGEKVDLGGQKKAERQGAAPEVKPKGDTGQAYQILLRPVLSEKGTHLAGSGKYVFAVHPRANKPEIKKSIQLVYDVHVEKVQIVRMPGKLRRYGKTQGRTAAWKKAIVTVRAGEKIPGIVEAVG